MELGSDRSTDSMTDSYNIENIKRPSGVSPNDTDKVEVYKDHSFTIHSQLYTHVQLAYHRDGYNRRYYIEASLLSNASSFGRMVNEDWNGFFVSPL